MTAGSGLNANHRQVVAGVFAQVDERLRTLEHLTQAVFSPFEATVADLSPEQAVLLLTAAASLRQRLLAALDRLGVDRPRPNTSARWSAYTALQFGEVDLLELTTDRLRGYGALDATAAAPVTHLVNELRDLLERLRRRLVPEGSRHDYVRLDGLSAASAGLLRPIAGLVAEHRLLEVRPLLAAAVDQADRETVDVGVFGRSGAGKSALLNALLGESLLPVDAVPVTAVPIRIRRGPAQTLRVRFVDGDARDIPRTGLADYATEAANPDNERGVWVIEAAAPNLAPGLRLIDTPGVGSPALTSASQAMAWALRCATGLVLVPASSAVAREDLMLIEALRRAGATCELLLSKSDLLTGQTLQRSRDYLGRALDRALGLNHGVAVTPVSAVNDTAGVAALRRRLDAAAAGDAARQGFARCYRQLLAATETALDNRNALTAERRDALARQAAAAGL